MTKKTHTDRIKVTQSSLLPNLKHMTKQTRRIAPIYPNCRTMEPYRQLGLVFRSARRELNLTQESVSRLLRLSRTMYQKYEAGEVRYDFLTGVAILGLLGVHYQDILPIAIGTTEESLENLPDLGNIVFTKTKKFSFRQPF